MQSTNIYSTLRIRYNDELKLFPSSKLLTLQDIKAKVINRFDLSLIQSQFDLEYFDWDSKGVLALDNSFDTHKIDPKIMAKLINQKIQLQVVKKQPKPQSVRNNHSKSSQNLRNHQNSFVNQEQQKPFQKPQKNKTVKHYAQCDKCMKFPILHIRYKCIICSDYDLCSQCYKQLEQEKGPQCHPYLKIRNPLNSIETIQVTFNQNDIDRLHSCKQQKKKTQKFIQKDFRTLEIDRQFLPKRTQVSKNFVQSIFGTSLTNKRNKVCKIDPSLDMSHRYPMSIDDCS